VETLEARQTTCAYPSLPFPDPPPRRVTEEIGAAPARLGTVRLRAELPFGGAVEMPLLPGREIVVGSGPLADLVLDDPTVSQRHCRVTHAGGWFEITDLGARNGVRIGGVRVARASLSIGGACELGRTALRFLAGAGGALRDEAPPLPNLIGGSPPMRALSADVRRMARLRLPALLRGESGTGKDLVARALHDRSPRATRPFVALNAAAISRELAESELFGHERGAFTGAVRERRGAFREAHGGTLFLDEIGAVPLEVQAKLLRAVEEGVVRPVGAEASVPVDVRLVAATCEPLEELVAERRFRADLLERLAVCVIRVPPLRERDEDVPALARHLLAASGFEDAQISEGALAALRAHRWPGNVRELRNVVVQAAVRSGGAVEAPHVAAIMAERTVRPRRLVAGDAVRIFEEAGRNVSAAARRADVPRSTMRDLLRAAGVPTWAKRQRPRGDHA
jgi:transcriptional regulator with PAS, ATPase and Fis domain